MWWPESCASRPAVGIVVRRHEGHLRDQPRTGERRSGS
jgi:hypothetical protein